jgi:peptide/nickel transport system permease protein
MMPGGGMGSGAPSTGRDQRAAPAPTTGVAPGVTTSPDLFPASTTATAERRRARGLRFLWYRVRQSPLTLVGAVLILLYLIMAIAAPLLAPVAPGQADPFSPPANFANQLEPAQWMTTGPGQPSCGCILGTTVAGADLWYGIVWGSRISMLMGVGVTLSGIVIGTALGLVAGWYGGWIDEVLLRLTDIFLSLPLLVLAIAIVLAFHQRTIWNIAIALMIIWWPTYTRLVRGQVLALRDSQFIEAAKASGLPNWYILVRHIVPNILSPIIVQGTLDIGSVVLIAAALSFIGFSSASELLPEWGRLVAIGQDYIATNWWTVLFPGLAIFGFVLGFNLLGDGLRDMLDPRGAR